MYSTCTLHHTNVGNLQRLKGDANYNCSPIRAPSTATRSLEAVSSSACALQVPHLELRELR